MDDDDAGPTNSAAAAPVPAAPEPTAAASASTGATATALYDYEAGEDNELSFPEDAVITNIVGFSLFVCFFFADCCSRPSLTKIGGMENIKDELVCSQLTTRSSMIKVARPVIGTHLAILIR